MDATNASNVVVEELDASIGVTRGGDGRRQPSPRHGRVHPCTFDEFDSLQDDVDATDVDTQTSQHRQERASLTGFTPKSRYSITSYVNPNASDAAGQDVDAMTKPEAVEAGAGIAYLVFTLVLTMYYLNLLAPVVSNDLWWAGFNSSGAHSYLIDLFNAQLIVVGDNATTLDAASFGLAKDYSASATPIHVSPVYARSIYYSPATNDVPTIIASLRAVTDAEMVATQHCWVDFNKTFEVAHTNERQRRCALQYADNAAMYWETHCRLVKWASWMWSFEARFNLLMGDALRSTTEGQTWLNRTANGFVSVAAETALWRHHGLTRYVLQWSNQKTVGIKDSIQVTNAFGATQTITIKRTAQASRGSWTTYYMTWGPWNEFMLYSTVVRSDPTHPRFYDPCSYDEYAADPANYTCWPCVSPWCSMASESLMLVPPTASAYLTRTHVGPFGSIDMFYVPIPASLSDLYAFFLSAATTLLKTNEEFRRAAKAIPNLKVDPVPRPWQSNDLMFMGGDPTCPDRAPKPFVQSSIAFDVTCSVQERHTLLLHKMNAVFAMFVSPSSRVKDVCSLCPTLAGPCKGVLDKAVHASGLLRNALAGTPFYNGIRRVHQDVAAMDVATIQYAISADASFLLKNPILTEPVVAPADDDSPPPSWDVFGWMYLFEWAEMSREVVSVEGDLGTYRLISDKVVPTVYEAQELEVPQGSSKYLWVISVVVSSLLLLVGVIVALNTTLLRGRIVGRNLFQFNRIVGAVWLGRPFLLVRGMTAVIILSTAPLRFISRDGVSSFEFQPRSVVESMLVAGEATWITYVLNDFLLLLTRNAQPHFAPMSTCLGWLIIFVWDVWQPTQATTVVDRKCTIDRAREDLSCSSGSVQLGDVNQAVLFAAIQCICVVVSFSLVRAWRSFKKTPAARPLHSHLLLSGTAAAFLHRAYLDNGGWQIDRASCAMAGLVALRDSIFDIKLWLVVHQPDVPHVKWGMKVFRAPDLNPVAKTAVDLTKSGRRLTSIVKMNRLYALAGLAYMCATLLGSITYLSLTMTNLANDFFWANYNSSREHVFLARLFNRELVFQPSRGPFDLTDGQFVDDDNFNITASVAPSVEMRRSYLSQIKTAESTKLLSVVNGLREMDACLAPWISTQYCYLDLDKRWEMANTAARQARCARRYAANGAVYLETLLRNVQWAQLQTCWGSSLTTALGSTIEASNQGKQWWASLQDGQLPAPDEVVFWKDHGIATYATDWQNYKTIGLIETFDVQNAFGISYSMTLKHTNGSFQLGMQTSMKMYWGFASDLWAVTDPGNVIFGKSLVRQSSAFAFANVSMEAVLVQNGTIPLTALAGGNQSAYAVFRQAIGPFGSVDLKHVAVPSALAKYVSTANAMVTQMKSQSATFAKYYNWLGYRAQVGYIPTTWLQAGWWFSVGGNLLCHDVSSGNMGRGMRIATGMYTSCGDALGEFVSASTLSLLLGVIGTNLTRDEVSVFDVQPTCAQLPGMAMDDCMNSYLAYPRSVLRNTTFFDPSVIVHLQELAAAAKDEVQKVVVEVAQYATRSPTSTDIALLSQRLFDSRLPSFDFVSWLLVTDWADASREVIAFEGDYASINVITSRTNDVGSLVNPLEIPVNVASYIRYACLYVTTVIICVAVLATMYLIASKGYVEGLNLLEINRVAGIVWIGRTILLVRSLSAIGLLSTEVLMLDAINSSWGFKSQIDVAADSGMQEAIRVFKTFLAAGEVSWLGFVLNDVFVVVTQQYTTAYVFKCNFVIWGVSAILSYVAPPLHTATIHRQCDAPQVDFQLVCRSGTIAIGSFQRFMTLVGLCVGSTFVCYLYERLRRPHLRPTSNDSLFLAASAKYVFDPTKWMANGVYFLDPASAVINGILSVRVVNSFYIFDLKIWRLFVIEETAEMRSQKEAEGAFHLLCAIPLID